jgi:DHA1 family tetracycline resistance protein-like MFS transporter
VDFTLSARFVFVTVLLDWLVVGISSPVFPKLIVDLDGGHIARSSEIVGLFTFAFALCAFFASPVLGLASDRFGRRPIILLSTLGSAVDCTILALAPNLAWLFVGRILTGLTAASATAAGAYVADVTPPEKRAAAFGFLGAAFGIGFAVGPAIGGLLASASPRLPFFLAAGLMLVSTIYGLFVLPESLPKEQRHTSMQWARANPVSALRLLLRHRELFGLAASLFCSNLAVQSFSVFVLYTIFRFSWGEAQNGLGLSLFGALTVIASVSTGKLVARLGPQIVGALGFALGTVGFLIYGFATTGFAFACALPLTGLWAIAGPPIQSGMSARVGPSEQGELQGAIASMRSIATIVGPPFFTAIFAAVSARNPGPVTGAPWFVGGGLLVVAALVSFTFLRPSRA